MLLLIGIGMIAWALKLMKKKPVKQNASDIFKERKEPIEFTPDFIEWRKQIIQLRNQPSR